MNALFDAFNDAARRGDVARADQAFALASIAADHEARIAALEAKAGIAAPIAAPIADVAAPIAE